MSRLLSRLGRSLALPRVIEVSSIRFSRVSFLTHGFGKGCEEGGSFGNAFFFFHFHPLRPLREALRRPGMGQRGMGFGVREHPSTLAPQPQHIGAYVIFVGPGNRAALHPHPLEVALIGCLLRPAKSCSAKGKRNKDQRVILRRFRASNVAPPKSINIAVEGSGTLATRKPTTSFSFVGPKEMRFDERR